MFVKADFISGFMIGLEFLWRENIIVFDLGIVRVFLGKIPRKE